MKIAVTAEAHDLLSEPLRHSGWLSTDDTAEWQLREDNGALVLDAAGDRGHPLKVDFHAGVLGYRLERVRHELLIRACRLTRADETPSVIDATAGLGRDAALLAMAGADVTLLEQQPLLHSLLADGLRRASPELAARITLFHVDSPAWLREHPAFADVVYLDPMFPERRKSAAVKKTQRWLQALAPLRSPEQEADMLRAARIAARRRVVIKRPLKAPFLANESPHHQLAGKTVRFDVHEIL